MKIPLIITVAIHLLLITTPASAEVYKCVDKSGKVTFSTKPGPGCTLLPGSASEKGRAPSKINWKTATEMVKRLPCKKGGTVDEFLTKKAMVPAVEDLDWHTYPRNDGFEVERFLLLNNRLKLQYKWHVSFDGHVKPISGKAVGITERQRGN